MTLKPIKQTVFFDLGNVLVFFDLDRMVRQLASCTQIPEQLLKEQSFQLRKTFYQYEEGCLTTQELYQHLRSRTSHVFSLEDLQLAISDIFTPNLELWPIVEKLKNQGSKLVLISNTNESHFQFIQSRYPILNQFDRFILSYKVKACKPQPEIYQRALEEAQGNTFYTDDIPEFIEAGRLAGLDAEVFTDVPTLQHHLIARQLLKIPS